MLFCKGDMHYKSSCYENLAPTILARNAKHGTFIASIQGDIARGSRFKQNGRGFNDDGTSYTLNSTDLHAVATKGDEMEETEYIVRRLTPLECERLQGFPDGWTDVPYKGKEHPSDAPRYKAIGNSFAVPVLMWIANRIDAVETLG